MTHNIISKFLESRYNTSKSISQLRLTFYFSCMYNCIWYVTSGEILIILTISFIVYFLICRKKYCIEP